MINGLNIDSEFQSLIPVLSEEEYRQLEQNLTAEGCRDALVCWNDGEHLLLIDGHNRFEICNRLALPYQVVERQFECREDVIAWIVDNQLGRRNLNAFVRGELALKKKTALAAKAKANQLTGLKQGDERPVLENSPKRDSVNTRVELAKEAGISDNTIAKIEKIIEKAPEPIKQAARNGEVSIHKAYQLTTRKENIEQRKQEKVARGIALPEGVFNVVYADPPWQYQNSGTDNSAESRYPTMPTNEICELIESIPLILANEAVLFLWATNPLLPDALKVIKAWGFEYKTNAVWVKNRNAGGFYVLGQHELLLIATRGGTWRPSRYYTSIIQGNMTRHSEKPALYEQIEAMYPQQRYIELFARTVNPRERWTYWGNQVDYV